MTALDNLTAAVTRLSGLVDQAITKITTGDGPAIQAQADALNAKADALATVLTPPAPPA